MKTILTIIFVFFIGVAVQAQDTNANVKVETVEMTIVTSTVNKNSVARLYKFRNSRVKRALAFTTKRNKAKLA